MVAELLQVHDGRKDMVLPSGTIRSVHVAAPPPLLARRTDAEIRGGLDALHHLTLQIELVSVMLGFCQRTEDHLVALSRQLLGDETLHAAEEEGRQQIVDEFLGRPSGSAQLMHRGVVRLAEAQGITDAGLPGGHWTESARIGPVQKRPELFVSILDGRPGQANSTESVDLIHGLGDFGRAFLDDVAFVRHHAVPIDHVYRTLVLPIGGVGGDHDL